MLKLRKDKTLFCVYHNCFATDTLVETHTLVRSLSKNEAVEKFNQWSKNKRGYPYLYNEVIEDNVFSVEILEN